MSGSSWIEAERGLVADWSGLEIVTHPHPALAVRSVEVERVDASVRLLAVRMAELMRRGVDDGHGTTVRAISLAANQVNVCQRIVVVDIPGKKSVRNVSPQVVTKGPLVLINPIYSPCQPDAPLVSQVERCVSYPGEELEIARHNEIGVSALNPRGECVVLRAAGLLSQCIQHCCDLLEGRSLSEMQTRAAEQNA